MKQIKTAYEILKESGVYPEDFISFSTMGGCENAMHAYAAQFIDAAIDGFRGEIEDLRKYRKHPENLTIRYQDVIDQLLKLKEHLK